ncbi:TlpA family protein disulfide reductase [Nonomuraea jabiensis]|uniref:Thiol-disulfide isomerase/thioredoxin n=1 Tax=Nonomuraea jabiensis TaxID=882448 RepID=A0A7W9GKA4_9ACTN|nr:TlpA disulfide reductase family protein [Nonomuraea jabiensis]MBB5785355.1 thiol-disulfide isomerase/thioredoxin [Nonomuraea jabiensis]
MSGLVAIVALVSVLTVLNLLLTFGVIRRLREHTELLAGRATPIVGEPPSLPVGRQVGDFAATTTDGEPVARALLAGDTLVAFLTPGCEPCEESLPHLVEAAKKWPGGRRNTLVVVIGRRDRAADHVERLAPVARVVVEAPDGPIATGFGVTAYPLFGVVDSSGQVLRSETAPAALLPHGVAPA